MMTEDLILWDVVEEHLDEASFLWSQWERALVSPLYTVKEVAERVERRMLAHLDGLVVGGDPVAEKLLRPALKQGSQGEAFAAAYALVDSGEAHRIEWVLESLERAKGEPLAGVARALELIPNAMVEQRMRSWLKAERPEVRAAALSILSFQRLGMGREAVEAMADADPRVRRAALVAAGRLGVAASAQWVRYLLSDPEEQVREAALTTGALLGVQEVWPICHTAARELSGCTATALLLLALSGKPAEQRLVLEAAVRPDLQKAAIFALGFCGTVEAVDVCVQLMAEPKLNKLATESVVAITGVDLEKEKLQAKGGAEEVEVEVGLDADLDLGPEDELAEADPQAMASWWEGQREGRQGGQRYLGGKSQDQELPGKGLQVAPMRRRRSLAMAVALQGHPLPELRTLACKQVS